MFIRLILLTVVVVAVLWLLKRLFNDDTPTTASNSEGDPKTENMRQCKYCGTHVPESLIIIVDDQPYCCEDHADRDQS